MCEKWLDVPTFEGLYQVSDRGRVRSLDRCSAGRAQVRGQLLTPFSDARGYLRVGLYWGERQLVRVHRLVAVTFIGPPPAPDYAVNHIDGNRHNNRVENLEWVTPSENNFHAREVLKPARQRERGN